MKKVVCGCFGTIYYAKILKEGRMSDTDRVDITDEAIEAVLNHIMQMSDYEDKGFAGYSYKTTGGGHVNLIAYDKDEFRLVRVNDKEKSAD